MGVCWKLRGGSSGVAHGVLEVPRELRMVVYSVRRGKRQWKEVEIAWEFLGSCTGSRGNGSEEVGVVGVRKFVGGLPNAATGARPALQRQCGSPGGFGMW